MTVNRYLRTKDLAQAVGISVQQVRNYEASGFIPAAERAAQAGIAAIPSSILWRSKRPGI